MSSVYILDIGPGQMYIFFDQMRLRGPISGLIFAVVLAEDLGLSLVERTPFQVWVR